MKAGVVVSERSSLVDLIGHLVPVSDFSKGKTAKIFEDIKKRRSEYVVLKNNQPSAVLMSVEHYSDIIKKARMMEDLLERIEDAKLSAEASAIAEKYDPDKADSMESILAEAGISEQEVDALMDKVEIE